MLALRILTRTGQSASFGQTQLFEGGSELVDALPTPCKVSAKKAKSKKGSKKQSADQAAAAAEAAQPAVAAAPAVAPVLRSWEAPVDHVLFALSGSSTMARIGLVRFGGHSQFQRVEPPAINRWRQQLVAGPRAAGERRHDAHEYSDKATSIGPLAAVTVWADGYVRGIQCTYRSLSEPVQEVVGPMHGHKIGDEQSLRLDADEFIVSVAGRKVRSIFSNSNCFCSTFLLVTSWIDRLSFLCLTRKFQGSWMDRVVMSTNKGRVLAAGGFGGNAYQLQTPKNSSIVGFHGRAGQLSHHNAVLLPLHN
jgi:hypothetical protein